MVELPRNHSELDRADVEQARLIVERRVLPDAVTRQVVLGKLLELIRRCEVKIYAWGLTLHPRNCRLNAGSSVVMGVHADYIELSCASTLGEAGEQWLEESAIIQLSSRSQSGNRSFHVDHRSFLSMPEEVWHACQEGVDIEIEAKKGRLPWWESNSPGLLRYLEQELDVEITYPDYSAVDAGVRYWKISPGARASKWDECRDGGFISMGWKQFGDLRRFPSHDEFEEERKKLDEVHEGYSKEGCGQVWQFHNIAPGDRILANKGTREVLGFGTVVKGYYFDQSDSEHPHRLGVEWNHFGSVKVSEVGWRRTLVELGKSKFARIEDRLDPREGPAPITGDRGRQPDLDRFRGLMGDLRDRGLYFPADVVARVLLAIQTKRFVVLSGISGTGKTQIALALARHFQGERQVRVTVEEEPEAAVRITVQPYMLKRRGVHVPVELQAYLDLPSGEQAPSTEVSVGFPGGVVESRLWKDRSRPVARFALRGDLGTWFRENLSVEDEFLLEAPESDEEPFLRLSLPQVEEKTELIDNKSVIAVRPDWTDNRGLLGFFNPLTEQYVGTPFLDLLLRAAAEKGRANSEGRQPWPFFAILDEMNLARVEQYFSDFLSALESGEPLQLHESIEVEEGTSAGAQVPRELRVPDNLVFVGTVNVDESTYMFSPKVLDRAFTVEFDEVDLAALGGLEPQVGAESLWLQRLPERLQLGEAPGSTHWQRLVEDYGDKARQLMALHALLETDRRHFGYRVANEIARFVLLAVEQGGEDAAEVAFDLAILQKVLPKLHGTQQELEPLLDLLFAFAVLGDEPSDKDLDRLRPTEGWEIRRGGVLVSEEAPQSDEESDGAAGLDGDELDDGDERTGAVTQVSYPRTAAKLWRMRRRLRQQGFTSFIE